MSVRRSSMKGYSHSGGGWGFLKAFGFWVFLFVASFIIGMVIISPLIHIASGTNNPPPSSGSTAANQNNNAAPAPQTPSGSPSPNRALSTPVSPENRSQSTEKPSLELTPDDSERTQIQRRESPDDMPRFNSSDSREEQTSQGSRRSSPRRSTRSEDPTATPDQSPHQAPDRMDSSSSRERSTRRSAPENDSGAPRRSEERPPRSGNGSDIQKKESLDN